MYGDVITKFSRMDSLPNFVTHNDPLHALCARESSASIQAAKVSRFRFSGNALWDRRSRKVSANSRISAITEYSFQLRVCLPFILSYFSVFNSSPTNPNQLHSSKVSSDGFRKILREKITFKVVISGQEFLTGCDEF